jgi:hypothetical protein
MDETLLDSPEAQHTTKNDAEGAVSSDGVRLRSYS